MNDGDDLARYSRQVVLRELGVNGQRLLMDSRALVCGLGGLGGIAAQYLVGAGVGSVLLADRDRIESSNLHRQTLYTAGDVGRPKAAAAAARLAALNPQARLLPVDGALDSDSLPKLVRDVDVVLDCTDNFPARFAINAACVAARKPLVSGAAIRFEGQLVVFDVRRADSPCYACVYPDRGEVAESCEEAGILGPVAGVIGSLQALAALQLLLGRAQPGVLRVWDAGAMSWRELRVPRDPSCTVCAHR